MFDRKSSSLAKERVYGGWAVGLVYANRFLARLFPRRVQHGLSWIYGWLQRTPLSRFKVGRFVRRYAINLQEFEILSPFRSFDAFFTRRFRKNARSFPTQLGELGAFAEGRYLALARTEPTTTLPIKGASLQIVGLLGSLAEKFSSKFVGGPVLIARLAPVDYHRFHFPDGGKIVAQSHEKGPLHSVNPIALRTKGDILFTNDREVTILESVHFGLLAMIEVGALMVGTIEQTFRGYSFERGQEKGVFHFGGSTVILLGQPGTWAPSADLLQRSERGIETLVRLGDTVGQNQT